MEGARGRSEGRAAASAPARGRRARAARGDALRHAHERGPRGPRALLGPTVLFPSGIVCLSFTCMVYMLWCSGKQIFEVVEIACLPASRSLGDQQ